MKIMMLKINSILETKRISAWQITAVFICLFSSCLSVYSDSISLTDEVVPLGEIVITVGESKIIRTELPTLRVSVTKPKTADVKVLTPYQIMLQGLNVGSTDVIIWSKDEDNIQHWKIRVVMDISTYTEKLKELFPHSSLQTSHSDETLIVKGLLRSTEQVRQLHDYLDKAEIKYVDMTSIAGIQQVQLQVRVAEVSRIALRTLAINAVYSDASFFGATNFTSSSGTGLFSELTVSPSYATTSWSASSAATLLVGIPNAKLDMLFKALAENQYLKLLANPTLVALSGEKASFLAGGEFPIPVPQDGGGATSITIEYREYGVRLTFQPFVLGDGSIRLYVAPEVSELTDVGGVSVSGFTVPALLTRKFETTLELNSGQTFAMAGLIKENTSTIKSRIPGLGDLPILGSLFRSVRYTKGETELVVFVTVNLVEPMSLSRTPLLPGFLHAEPNDWEFYLEGRMESKEPAEIHPDDAERLKEMGLDNLIGPGAWESSD